MKDLTITEQVTACFVHFDVAESYFSFKQEVQSEQNHSCFVLFLMYPYHNKIKQRIANKELLSYEYVEKYKQIAPCLLLHFETEPKVRPIREHRFEEYEELFKNLNQARD